MVPPFLMLRQIRILPRLVRSLWRLALLSVSAAFSPCLIASDTPVRHIPVPDGDFETGAMKWNFESSRATATIAAGSGVAGSQGLRIESQGDDKEAFVSGPRIPVEAGIAYTLSWQGRMQSGTGTNVYLRFFDAGGAEISRQEGRITTDKGFQWDTYKLDAIPPEGAKEMEIFIQRPTWRPFPYVAEVDNFQLKAAPIPVTAPWEGSYKIRPDESTRLTAADVIGPDGKVYPDWTWAGVPGGIPDRPVVVRLAELGAVEGSEIAGLLEQAAAQVSAAGGGAVEIGEGTFSLESPVLIFSDNVVLRGAGKDKTRLIFRYHIPKGEIRFFRLKPDQVVGQNVTLEFHANPSGLEALEWRSGNATLRRAVRKDHWGNTFGLRMSAREALSLLGEGPHVLTALAEYRDGSRVEQSIPLNLSKEWIGETAPIQLGAINFVGRGAVGNRVPVQSDVKRGDRVLTLPADHGLEAGDRLNIVAPASSRWRELVGHNSPWEIQAQDLSEVVAVDGGRVTLRQPLRIAFLKEDGSFVQKYSVLEGAGVEDLFLEQEIVAGPDGKRRRPSPDSKEPTEDLWISGVIFNSAWGGWLRNVTIKNAGRNATYFPMSKHIEVRDALFDDSLFKADGGTGYIGFDRSFDCLMDGVEARRMRHGPNAQWNSSGNVVRNSRFLGSDAQWHAGFAHENLYENNFIDARGPFGSYGHGLYASGPSSGLHGPQGPRNVVYNNDIVCRKDGLHMLGSNEGWMILHNRFEMDGAGRAVFAKERSFDHIIEGNVFILRRALNPPVFLGSDSVGVELMNNRFYGVSGPIAGFAGGLTRLAKDEGNVVEAEVPVPVPDRPKPPVPSIFQWQRDNAKLLPKDTSSLPDAATPAALPE